uniref:solute carrier organic anion transporter family member 4C1-like n=1 Tax=Styela clava TaxID=7725 RepID=UPI001939D895|nr:solute carrier organic anion transporter family member 4C1-like [Styela clava]
MSYQKQSSKDEVGYPGQEFEGNYGYCGCEPKFLQCGNNPLGFLAVFSLFLIAQGMLLNGIFNVIITTLEQRFGFTSSETGLIAVSYDIGYWIFVLFVTYYANRGHRPKMLAIGSIFLGTGALLFAVPHFTTSLYEYGDSTTALCYPNKTISCSEQSENLHGYLYLFIFSMLLQGMGCVPLYTVSYAVLEDSLPKAKSPLYLSFANAMSLLGPVFGYILGGYLLTVYVDFNEPDADKGDLTLYDPRWVGAWWVGHLVSAGMCYILVMIPMFGFPRQFPGSAKTRAERDSEVHVNAGAEITEKEGFGKSIKDMPVAIMTLLKNPTYILTVSAGASEAFIISGFTAFLPKVIENQYNTTPSAAALYAGAISLPGGVLGHLIAGGLVSKFNMRTKQLLKLNMACIIGVIILSPIGLYHCNDPKVAGVTVSYEYPFQRPDNTNLDAACNNNCGECEEEYFIPVCQGNFSYFSACHAGCSIYYPEYVAFGNCSCVLESTNGEISTATLSLCENPCDAIIPYMAVFFVITLLNFIISTPCQLVILRCVPDSQRSFAVGLQVFLLRTFGSIPGPLVFGVILDSTCLLWQEKSCPKELGSCYIYDSNQLAINLMSLSMAFKALSTLLFYLAMRFYRTSGTEKIVEVPDLSLQNQKENLAFHDKEFTEASINGAQDEYHQITQL